MSEENKKVGYYQIGLLIAGFLLGIFFFIITQEVIIFYLILAVGFYGGYPMGKKLIRLHIQKKKNKED